ncbi:DivIVA domain-containing protein [Galbitalea sp. SE-J8]|uniref:DivIVA domain-containing protein n=1 Tax=Galbitalea sp. SE-J8 TaxID=3054952 RepID=UPI00259CDCE5|nr:DivIVA domain-containing protein [Galbitalea sp. SE-J8]MDM4764254.1 DivIVA domain-containing protein [Galbitalea sp. SE-J8]
MALTPEDVVNKRFQPTKFREGYDQDEVDDFLDEVVVELRRLGQENEELRQRLVASEQRVAEAQRQASAAPAPAFGQTADPFGAPPAAPAPAYVAPQVDANPLDPNNTNNLLQLARRLHEEHVREGVEKRDALIAEGQAQAQRVLQEAEQAAQGRVQEAEQAAQARVQEVEQAAQTRVQEVEQAVQARVAEAEAGVRARVQELEQQQRVHLGTLEQERVELQGRVDGLKAFERDYRAKLKSYIEGQLRDLEGAATTTASVPVAAPSATTAASPVVPGAPAAPQGYPAQPAQDYPAPREYAAPEEFSVPEFSAAEDYPAPSSQPQSFPGFGQG